MNQVTITPTDNGPYLIQGTATLLDADGRPYEASDPIALCRCGHSNRKPFCDGSHERANLAALADSSRTVSGARLRRHQHCRQHGRIWTAPAPGPVARKGGPRPGRLVHACEALAERLDVPPRTLDNWLWNRGQGPPYNQRPPHLTRTIYYCARRDPAAHVCDSARADLALSPGAPVASADRSRLEEVSHAQDAAHRHGRGGFGNSPPAWRSVGAGPPDACLSLVTFEVLPATIVGTDGNDVIRGTEGPDVIVGLGGNDVISAVGGDDTICGGLGNDRIDGGAGSDSVLGDTGESFLLGNPQGMFVPGGDDVLIGGDGDDAIAGEAGADNIRAGDGNDFGTGNVGEDVVDGDAGDDELFGGPAEDVVKGGDGNDGLIGNFGSDVLLGGKGDDMILGDNPQGPADPSHDVCNGQQGSDFAVEGTCEQANQIEATGPFPEG